MTNHKQHLGSGVPGSLPKINHLIFELDLGPMPISSYTESINDSGLFKDYTGNEVHMQDYSAELLRRCTCLSSVPRRVAVQKGGATGKSAKPTFFFFGALWVEINTICFSQKVSNGEGTSKRVQADEVSSSVPPAGGRSTADVNAAEV